MEPAKCSLSIQTETQVTHGNRFHQGTQRRANRVDTAKPKSTANHIGAAGSRQAQQSTDRPRVVEGGREGCLPNAGDEAAHPGGERPAAQQHSIRFPRAGSGAGGSATEVEPAPP